MYLFILFSGCQSTVEMYSHKIYVLSINTGMTKTDNNSFCGIKQMHIVVFGSGPILMILADRRTHMDLSKITVANV